MRCAAGLCVLLPHRPTGRPVLRPACFPHPAGRQDKTVHFIHSRRESRRRCGLLCHHAGPCSSVAESDGTVWGPPPCPRSYSGLNLIPTTSIRQTGSRSGPSCGKEDIMTTFCATRTICFKSEITYKKIPCAGANVTDPGILRYSVQRADTEVRPYGVSRSSSKIYDTQQTRAAL